MLDNHHGENLIFIISQPRAGSTILQRLIQGHPDIYSTPEPWIMLHPLYGLRKQGVEAEYNTDLANTAVRDFYAALPDGEENYYEGLRRMYAPIYQAALETSGKKYFLDKTPRYYHVIPELAQTFPKAKFIFLFRNPLAVLTSILTTWIGPYFYKISNLKHDLLNAPDLLIQGTKTLKNQSLAITHYEQLVTNVESELKNICSQLSLDFHSDMLNCKPVMSEGFGYKDQPQSLLKSGLIVDDLDKWKLKLDSAQRWRIAYDYLKILGYQTVSDLGYSYSSLMECLDFQENKARSILPTLSLEWLLMSKTEQKKTIHKYVYAQVILKLLRSVQAA